MFEDISFVELEEKHKEDEGLVLVGCGGEPEEWFEGVSGLLNDAKSLQMVELILVNSTKWFLQVDEWIWL